MRGREHDVDDGRRAVSEPKKFRQHLEARAVLKGIEQARPTPYAAAAKLPHDDSRHQVAPITARVACQPGDRGTSPMLRSLSQWPGFDRSLGCSADELLLSMDAQPISPQKRCR